MLRHAGGDALNIGHVLIAQAHRVTLTGGTLLGRPLRGRRLPRQHKPDQRGDAKDRCAMQPWPKNSHGRFSLPVVRIQFPLVQQPWQQRQQGCSQK
jgi:hypothetical protein